MDIKLNKRTRSDQETRQDDKEISSCSIKRIKVEPVKEEKLVVEERQEGVEEAQAKEE